MVPPLAHRERERCRQLYTEQHITATGIIYRMVYRPGKRSVARLRSWDARPCSQCYAPTASKYTCHSQLSHVHRIPQY